MDSLTDWLRCRPAKPMVSLRLDSNPTVVQIAAHACRTYRDNGTCLTTSPLNFAVVLMFIVPDLIKRPLADSAMHRAGLASGQQHTTDHWTTHLLTSIRRTKTRRDRCLHRPTHTCPSFHNRLRYGAGDLMQNSLVVRSRDAHKFGDEAGCAPKSHMSEK